MIAFGTPTHSIVVVSNIRDDAKEKSVENGFWGCNIVCALTGPNHLLWSTSSPESEEEINNSFNLSNSITMDTLCLSTWQWHQVVLVLCSCHRWLSQFSFDAAGKAVCGKSAHSLILYMKFNYPDSTWNGPKTSSFSLERDLATTSIWCLLLPWLFHKLQISFDISEILLSAPSALAKCSVKWKNNYFGYF